MYGIEQKIINWLKKQKTQPVTSNTEESVAKTASNEFYSIEDSSNDANDSSKNVKKEMLETIKNYADKLEGVIDDEFLKKLEYEEKSEEEIKNLADEYAQDIYDVSKAKLDGNIEKKRQESLQKEEEIKSQNEPNKQEIDQKYETLLDNAQNKAIKNGVARSSILAETIKNLSQDKIQEYLNVDNKIASLLKENANKLQAYEIEYNTAVKALEIEKAIDVKEKIEALTKEQQKKIDEVIKYNNSIDEKIYKLKSQGVELPNEEEAAEYKKQMLNTALKYYYSLDPEVARQEFKKDVDVQYALGDVAQVVERYLKNR